jgi:hypothetical protein
MKLSANNPYIARSASNRQTFVMAKTGEGLKDALKRRGSDENLIAPNDELNAGSKRELMKQIAELVDQYRSGNIVRANKHVDREVVEARRQIVAEAIADKSGPAWRILGEVIGEEIQLTMDREGFSRKTLLMKPLGRGEIGRLRIRKKDVVAWMVTANPEVVASVIRQSWVYPAEFYLLARILIENREIEQNTGDILDEKYQDGLEAIMVQEDKIWMNLADSAAGTSNDINYFNALTPAVFSSLRTSIQRWGLPVVNAILAFDLWDDIIANTGFSDWFDPVAKHQLILEGILGELLGVTLTTDAFREQNLQVLPEGSIYMTASPQTLGGITQRAEVSADPIDTYNEGAPNRGWFLQGIEGMAICNSRAIAKGLKI